MAILDFVKDAGKSLFGKAEAATPTAPAEAPKTAEAAAAPSDTQRKVDTLKAELRGLGRRSGQDPAQPARAQVIVHLV